LRSVARLVKSRYLGDNYQFAMRAPARNTRTPAPYTATDLGWKGTCAMAIQGTRKTAQTDA